MKLRSVQNILAMHYVVHKINPIANTCTFSCACVYSTGYFVMQLAEHIRGSEKTSAQSHASTHSSGARIGLSKEGWRVRIRQAWLTGLLERSMRLGKGHNLLGKIAFNTFQLSDQGQSYLLSPHSITLPPASTLTRISAAKQNSGECILFIYPSL